MSKQVIGFRIDDEMRNELENIAESNDESLSETILRALRAFLASDTDKPDIYDMQKRLSALESKFQKLKEDDKHQDISFKKSSKKIDSSGVGEKDPAELGELITIQEISELTGYAVSSLRSKLSRSGIEAVERIGGNRGGLYDKQEVIERVGFK